MQSLGQIPIQFVCVWLKVCCQVECGFVPDGVVHHDLFTSYSVWVMAEWKLVVAVHHLDSTP